MQKYEGFNFNLSNFACRYGKYNGKFNYIDIASIDDEKLRNEKVDMLVDELIKNSEETGFFTPDEHIFVNFGLGKRFKIDDREIYHSFFNNLNKILKQKKSEKPGIIRTLAVTKTILDYYGKYNPKNANKRFELLDYWDADEAPSIKGFKKQNSAACVENSALAHNLFLLAGEEAYYCISKDTKFSNIEDGHAFVILKRIIQGKEKFGIYDLSLQVYKELDGNPIKDCLDGKPLIVNGNIYANARNANNKK